MPLAFPIAGDFTGNSAKATKAFDSYVASKFGSTWYDGSATGAYRAYIYLSRESLHEIVY